ncbi:MAG: prephenate dehydratase [bacterium]
MSDHAQQTALSHIRQQIDDIDEKVLKLLNQRAQCAQQVAEIKQAHLAQSPQDSETSATPAIKFYRPEREAQILRRMMAENTGPLQSAQITRIYREIISSCLSLEETLRIAFLGPEGTFTQAAVHKHFGHAVNTLPCEAIDVVFREVEAGQAHYGIVPIENSTEGVVTHTLDTFLDSDLQICGEVHLPIHQNLMGQNHNWQQAKRVYSHQQSLAQCRKWLDSHLPHAERIAVNSNAEAAYRVSQESNTVAIAGQQAAEVYGLKVVQMNIEDQPNNTTRFLIIGDQKVAPSGCDKTSLLVSASNRPGSLYQLLQPLAQNNLDMTRIESRPSRCKNWEYVFFLDVKGHENNEDVHNALAALQQEAEFVRVLGSYPSAVA